MNQIAVLIPVYNRLRLTRECLYDLEKQKNSPFFTSNRIHIIVIDDGSTDGTSEWIRMNFPETIILQGTGNLWWSGSMNLGIRFGLNELKCDFIHFWQDDITPDLNYFNNLHNIIQTWDGSSIICSKIYFKASPEKIFAMGGKFNPHTGFNSLIGRLEPDGPKYNQIIEVDWFCGQGTLIHKSVFDKVGLLDEKLFPQYHGDIDFALRAKKCGIRILVHPDLRFWNDTSSTGISHKKNKTLRQFVESLYSIRSNSNIIKDFKFYHRHTTNLLAYSFLLKKYLIYIGSYIKWKVIGWFGIYRKSEELY
jgi:GT2 family glycosyltransferase